MDERISTRFWFEHSSGTRLHPYKLRDKRTGRLAFRVAEPRTGANRVVNQSQLDDVEDVYRHVIQMGWSVRMKSIDGSTEGLYNKDGYSIVRHSESNQAPADPDVAERSEAQEYSEAKSGIWSRLRNFFARIFT